MNSEEGSTNESDKNWNKGDTSLNNAKSTHDDQINISDPVEQYQEEELNLNNIPSENHQESFIEQNDKWTKFFVANYKSNETKVLKNDFLLYIKREVKGTILRNNYPDKNKKRARRSSIKIVDTDLENEDNLSDIETAENTADIENKEINEVSFENKRF